MSGYRTFKHFYLYYVKEDLRDEFPVTVSYNRFTELMQSTLRPGPAPGHRDQEQYEECADGHAGQDTPSKKIIHRNDKRLAKEYLPAEHSRHRSFGNFITNLVASLIAYSFQEKKPGIKFETENTSQLTLLY